MQFGTTIHQEIIDVRFYWRKVRRHPWLILSVVLVSLALAYLYISTTRPIYRATAKLLIAREGSKVAPFESLLEAGRTASHFETQYKILLSRTLARRVVDVLGLRDHPEFLPKAPRPHGVQQALKVLSGWLVTVRQTLVSHTQASESSKAAGGAPPASPAAVSPGPDSLLVDQFLDRLRVKSDPKIHLVDVSFTAYTPELAARVVNTLSQVYIDFNQEMRYATLHDALDWLQRQVGDMRQKVEASERALQQYTDVNDIYLINDEDRLAEHRQEIQTIRASLTQVTTERIELEVIYNEIQRAMKKGQDMEWLPTVVENPLIQNLKSRYVDLQRTYARLGQKYNESHPQVVQLRVQLKTFRTKIAKEVDKIVRAAITNYRLVLAREWALKERLSHAQREAKEFNAKAMQYGVFKREADSNRRLSELLLNRLKEASISTDLTSGDNIRIIDPAETPTSPINLRPSLALGIAGLLGLTVGVGCAIMLGFLDTNLRTHDEAEAFLGVPVLGLIKGFRPMRETRVPSNTAVVSLKSPYSQVTEAFKTLRANLLFGLMHPPRQVLLVTSPQANDGKTTVAANLAAVMAQTERRVLLVDADLRHPSVQHVFRIDADIGLSNFLLGETDEERIIGECEAALAVVTAGTPPPNPSELLGSERMQQFLAFAREAFDIVIIDSPPILAVSDALVLSAWVDSTLIVLRAGTTSYEDAQQAVAPFIRKTHLTPSNAGENWHEQAALGLVMNFIDPREKPSYRDQSSS